MLQINQEFKDLIPPLTSDEYSCLEQNLIEEGCRDTIKIWKGIVVDGHNRYEICQKHGLPYNVAAMRFSSKDEAMGWIIDNQLGRRNLSDAAYIELVIQKAELGHYSNLKTNNIRKIVAKVTGYSEGKIHQYMKIRKLKDAEIKNAVKRGDIKIGAAYKGLELTTKTVTELCPGWVPKPNGAHIAAVTFESMKRIGALYGFIDNNYGIACDGGACPVMRKRYMAQLKLVEACRRVME